MAQASTQQELLSKTIITLPDGFSLRPNRPGDEVSITHHANNRKVWLNLTDRFPHPYTEADSIWWTNFCSNSENWLATVPSTRLSGETDEDFNRRIDASKLPGHYAICHNDQVIGSIGLMADPAGMDHVFRLGYWLGEEYWGKGLMTNVVRAFVKWSFDTFPRLLRFEVDAYGWNPGSQAVLRKAGFEYEFTQKFRYFKDGKYTDLVWFSMLRPGWDGTA